ncbi:MAG: NAD-dependent epimerase/dehydratase family protein [Caldilineaceae bacterium]
MRKPVILITGASGEVGQALVHHLADGGRNRLLTLDLRPPRARHRRPVVTHIEGDLLNKILLTRLVSDRRIYHLAALLSTSSEFTPEMATRSTWRGC